MVSTRYQWIMRPTRLGLPAASLGLLVVGLALRLLWALLHPIEPVDDFLEYHELAKSVAFHGYYGLEGDASAFRPPGWPFALAAVYWVFGDDRAVGSITVALFSWGTAVLGSYVAWRLLRPAFAIFAAALLALMPSAVLYSGVLGTEFPSAFLMMAIALALTVERPGLLIAVGIGLAEGALLLTRSDQGIAMAVAIAIVYALRWRNTRRPAALPIVTSVIVLAVLAPWVIRNASVFDEFIPLSTNGGVTFYVGTLDAGYSAAGPDLPGVPTGTTPAARDRFYLEEGFDNIAEDPVQWLRYVAERFVQGYASDIRILAWGDAAPFGSLAFHASDAVWHLTAFLALIGMISVVVRRDFDSAWLVILIALVIATLLKLVFLFDGRHRVPLVPLLILLAGLGAQVIYDGVVAPQRRLLQPPPGT